MYPGMPEPRLATPRNLNRATYGTHVAAASSFLKRPLIPWQRFAADVAGEVDDDGMLWYTKVLLTVQRQAGKTALDLAGNVQVALSGQDRRAWYTAQTGQHASSKWREMSDTFVESRLKRMAHRRLTNGSEALTFVNGSTFSPHPPSPESLHSKQSDRNSVDEAWAHTELAGDALLQAIVPTTTTRRMLIGQQPQLWIISTEGTVESTFFNREIEQARAMQDPRTCVIDFGLWEGDDADDLVTVARRHPGFGHILDMETLKDARGKLPLGEFARAYGNRRTGATERIFPAGPWKNAAFDLEIPIGPMCFGAATGVDGVDTTITVSQRIGDIVVTAIPEGGHGLGTYWGIDYLINICTQYDNAPVAIDRVGPSAALYDAAKRAGLRLVDLDSASVSAACQNTLSGIVNPKGATWRYRPHPALEAAAELATRRWISDGAWVFGRTKSVGSISALEAANLSSWGIDHMPAKMGMQLG